MVTGSLASSVPQEREAIQRSQGRGLGPFERVEVDTVVTVAPGARPLVAPAELLLGPTGPVEGDGSRTRRLPVPFGTTGPHRPTGPVREIRGS